MRDDDFMDGEELAGDDGRVRCAGCGGELDPFEDDTSVGTVALCNRCEVTDSYEAGLPAAGSL